MNESLDVSRAIVAKSDQLNADDLVGGPITVQIIDAAVKDATEQPVSLSISGHQPWKPCKTMLRVLVAGWGKNAANWIGRWVTLYCDSSVKWGGEAVGGIRVAAMSDIPKRIEISLALTKGKKSKHLVEILDMTMSLDEFQRWCAWAVKSGGWTKEQVTAAIGGGKAADVKPAARRALSLVLSVPPKPAESSEPTAEEKAEILRQEREEAARG